MTANILFVFAGNCRTFIDCFDSCYRHVISKLINPEAYNIYLYFYLKLTDPGPKGMHGWNFSYKDIQELSVLDKITQIQHTYPHLSIKHNLILSNEITDADLLSQVKSRHLFVDFYAHNSFLLRGMHCHYNLEQCGKYILQTENELNKQFTHIVYVRPDLLFTEDCSPIETYDTTKVIVGTGINHTNNDHIALIPRQYMEHFFFDRMKVYRENTTKRFRMAEDVYWHTIPHIVVPMGRYTIKRS